MRVVDNHQKRLSLDHAFKSAGYRAQISNARFDRRVRNPQSDSRPNRGEDVVNINPADERRFNLNRSRRSRRSEIQPLKTQRKFLGLQVDTVVQSVGKRLLAQAEQFLSPFIVGVDYRSVRHPSSGAFKQASLRSEIV